MKIKIEVQATAEVDIKVTPAVLKEVIDGEDLVVVSMPLVV